MHLCKSEDSFQESLPPSSQPPTTLVGPGAWMQTILLSVSGKCSDLLCHLTMPYLFKKYFYFYLLYMSSFAPDLFQLETQMAVRRRALPKQQVLSLQPYYLYLFMVWDRILLYCASWNPSCIPGYSGIFNLSTWGLQVLELQMCYHTLITLLGQEERRRGSTNKNVCICLLLVSFGFSQNQQ